MTDPTSASSTLASSCSWARFSASGKQRHRLQRRRHRVAGIHRAAEHHAVDRRTDRRLGQIGLVGGQRGARDGHVGDGARFAGHGSRQRRARGCRVRWPTAPCRPTDAPLPRSGPAWPWLPATVAAFCACSACAAASDARERVTWSVNLDASSSTSTWPFFTRSFTSTSTRVTVPESSLPMFTERVGCSVPLAETLSVRLPLRQRRRHVGRRGAGGLAAPASRYRPPAATSSQAPG